MKVNSVSLGLNTNISFKHKQENTIYLPSFDYAQRSVSANMCNQMNKIDFELEDNWLGVGRKARNEIRKGDLYDKIVAYKSDLGYLGMGAQDSKKPLIQMLCDIYSGMLHPFTLTDLEVDKYKCFLLESKSNKNLADKIIDFIGFHSKMHEIVGLFDDPNYDFENTTFRFDNIDLKDTFNTNEEYQEHIAKTLVSRKKHYDETGRKTIIHIYDMEKLLRTDTNKPENIGMMRTLMQQTNKAYASQVYFAVSDFKGMENGTRTSNRIRMRFDIDKLGITEEQLEKLEPYKKEFAPIIETVSKIYNETWQTLWSKRKEFHNIKNEYEDVLYKLRTCYTSANIEHSQVEQIQEIIGHYAPEEELIIQKTKKQKNKVHKEIKKITPKTKKLPLKAIGMAFIGIISAATYFIKMDNIPKNKIFKQKNSK